MIRDDDSNIFSWLRFFMWNKWMNIENVCVFNLYGVKKDSDEQIWMALEIKHFYETSTYHP